MGILILSLYFINASYTITTSAIGNSNTSILINTTITNPETNPNANITKIEITTQSNFNLTTNSEGSDALGSFSKSSNILTWENTTTLINASESRSFWFNTTANNGTYDITINITNSTGTYTNIESITIFPPYCTQNWNCTNWTNCTNSTQTRNCTDLNACGNLTGIPILNQSCGNCTADWN